MDLHGTTSLGEMWEVEVFIFYLKRIHFCCNVFGCCFFSSSNIFRHFLPSDFGVFFCFFAFCFSSAVGTSAVLRMVLSEILPEAAADFNAVLVPGVLETIGKGTSEIPLGVPLGS